mgnify:CR=1 FL=1
MSQELDKLTRCTREKIKAMVPTKKQQKKNGRTMSDDTITMHEERRRSYEKKKTIKEERKKWNKKIARSCREDYRKWVIRWTEQIEIDFHKGNAKTIFAGSPMKIRGVLRC